MNGKFWPVVISTLLTIGILLMGLIVSRLETIDVKVSEINASFSSHLVDAERTNSDVRVLEQRVKNLEKEK